MPAKKERDAVPVQEPEKRPDPLFEKRQIMGSAKYESKRDLVDALLDEGRKYTIAEIDRKISDYEKGAVK